MNIAVLTSSRADFGIYRPLLDKLKSDVFFTLRMIAFGTHVSRHHGETIYEIEEAGFEDIDTIGSLLAGDDEQSISTSYGLTVMKFADYWASHRFDLVFCLGDRFEMSAAVQAGIPFGVTFVHIHGGETTLGAIDNIYRHQITLASKLHFTSTEQYAEKVRQLTGQKNHIVCTGSLSLEGVDRMNIMDEALFRGKYSIPDGDYALITVHPETVNAGKNKRFILELKEALRELALSMNLVITLPNADTHASFYRKAVKDLKELHPDRVVLVENFGRKNYFAAMEYAKLMIGNSSSGIIEGATFQKYVVNIGDRQKGRARGENILNCSFRKDEILKTIIEALGRGSFSGKNIYYRKNPAEQIIKSVKAYYETL